MHFFFKKEEVRSGILLLFISRERGVSNVWPTSQLDFTHLNHFFYKPYIHNSTYVVFIMKSKVMCNDKGILVRLYYDNNYL